jgi:hypothetical protein
MDDNTAAANHGSWVFIIRTTDLIIVKYVICGFVPNPDAEFVLTAAAVYLSVNCRQQKCVIAISVNRS